MTNRRSVVVLDYGSGNLRSAERALRRVGADVTVTADLDAVRRSDAVVVPGVGAYAACMAGIEGVGAGSVICERVQKGRPVLGICVGMQVLFERGEEHDTTTAGLGVLPGEVRRLHAPVLPHMGWNTVTPADESVLFEGLAGAWFYFVHSYAAVPMEGATKGAVTTAVHGEPFVAAVELDGLCATQFHPEKSGDAGSALLANWLGSLS